MKKLLSIGLTLALTLGLATPALAYSTPDFSDVPQSHWAYPTIMEMADAGIIQGTGNGWFSPEEPLSAEMFLTLVGRVMYPEIQVQDGEWSEPYVEALKEQGMLNNTNVTAETLQAPISRYDMASVLALCAWELDVQGYGAWAKDSYFEFADGEDMPERYAGSVSLARAVGLVRGDESRRFHGDSSMTRQEAAVVIARLSYLKRSLDGSSPAALTVKGHALSVADLDYYYHNAVNAAYEQELMLESLYVTYGLGTYTPSFDPLSSLKTQYVDEAKTQSYHDYFLEQAKTNAIQTLALSDAAKAHGYTMSQDGQEALKTAYADLDEQVKMYRCHSRESYLKSVYGLRMTEEVYSKNLELELLAKDYYDAQINAMGGYSEEALTTYYREHPSTLNSYDYNYAWFDGSAEEGTDHAAAQADARKRAETMLAAVKASDGTSEAFSNIAKAEGVDAPVPCALQGGRFVNMPYAAWMMDSSRRDGDVALFYDDQGYYVVQFHKAYRDDTPKVDFRHILLRTKTEEGDALTDEQVAQAEARARELLAQFLAGERTAEAFGALADQYSEDARNWEDELLSPGGLYEWTKQGDTVQPIDDWCFDSSRQVGDTALIQSEYGWHVLYFQGRRSAWMDLAETEMKDREWEAFNKRLQAGYEAVEGPGWSWVGLGVDEIDG